MSSTIYRSQRIRGVCAEVKAAAKSNRATMTSSEARLWQALRCHRLEGLKFRRQHAIGHHIADFYCASHKLIVEVDGDYHTATREEDRLRDEVLASYGYSVLRIANQDIIVDLDGVLQGIAQAAMSSDFRFRTRDAKT